MMERVVKGKEYDVWKCPRCGTRERLLVNQSTSHEPGSLECLQNQIADLQSTVGAIVDKFGGEL